LIIPKGPGKNAVGSIVCGGCGVSIPHPTHESDTWSACWCRDPDRCPACGECEPCWAPLGGGER